MRRKNGVVDGVQEDENVEMASLRRGEGHCGGLIVCCFVSRNQNKIVQTGQGKGGGL